jgi:hypothetical protein
MPAHCALLGLINAIPCLWYRNWRTAPRLLRSNIPRSALCATFGHLQFIYYLFNKSPALNASSCTKKSILQKNDTFPKGLIFELLFFKNCDIFIFYSTQNMQKFGFSRHVWCDLVWCLSRKARDQPLYGSMRINE